MSQFNPGDLALIVRDNHPANIGRVVELQFMVSVGQAYTNPRGLKTINTAPLPVWIVTADGLCSRPVDGEWSAEGWTQKAARSLMPLRGDFAPERQQAREVNA